VAQIARLSVVALVASSLVACAGPRPSTLGPSGERLAACPASPNCVSSDATDAAHAVAPFALAVPAAQAWPVVLDAVAALPRTRIVTDAEGYLHAECRSALLGFVDDLELQLHPSAGQIAVRSASRLGHSDLGVNRRRVETLRRTLAARGVLRPDLATDS
jgi:uncharacterized protein (DUF1499 family)